MRIAVMNAGSSTLKGSIVEVGASPTVTRARAARASGPESNWEEIFADLLDELLAAPGRVDGVGHRIVHGGGRFRSSVHLDPPAERALCDLGHLAPLHNPPALAGIRAARARLPKTPQVAVFDTAFHAGRSAESVRYALPWDLCEELGLSRFGFHGIAHAALTESVAEWNDVQARDVNVVTLQLGSGCSVCAVERGRSIETSMGLSPFGGLPMATRSGDLDPGVLLTLVRNGWQAEDLERLLARDSGLRGMCGRSDFREVLRAEAEGDERAAVALALFVRQIVSHVGAYLTLLGGEGAIAFGGGIGAGSAEIRARVAKGLGAWNVELDPARNRSLNWGRISREGSRPVYAFETDEERVIACETHALLGKERDMKGIE